VQACGPEAIVHKKQATLIDLEVGSIIYADKEIQALNGLSGNGKGVYRVSPQDSLMGSAAAAHIMSRLVSRRPLEAPISGFETTSKIFGTSPADGERVGVFICKCDHLISEIVDTEALRERAATWPGVAHAQVLQFSCTPEAQATIQKKVQEFNLNRITLGACACCSLDQVCYSCTYQRVRCKATFPGRLICRRRRLSLSTSGSNVPGSTGKTLARQRQKPWRWFLQPLPRIGRPATDFWNIGPARVRY
jgi:hypothetical protein